MRTFRYVQPGNAPDEVETVTMTYDQIMAEYYPVWCKNMRKVGRDHLISPEHCLDDWITVHWAEEVKP